MSCFVPAHSEMRLLFRCCAARRLTSGVQCRSLVLQCTTYALLGNGVPDKLFVPFQHARVINKHER
jgi:hypothetical protein